MRISEFETDHDSIENGTWRDAVGLPGVKLQVRGIGNVAYRRLQAKLAADRTGGAALDPIEDDRLMGRLLHETVLLGWKGITEEAPAASGSDAGPTEREVPFTPERARELLTEPRFKRFQGCVYATATILANETKAEREAAAKN